MTTKKLIILTLVPEIICQFDEKIKCYECEFTQFADGRTTGNANCLIVDDTTYAITGNKYREQDGQIVRYLSGRDNSFLFSCNFYNADILVTFNFKRFLNIISLSEKTLQDTISVVLILLISICLIPDWLIFDQSRSWKMARFLKKLMAGK